MDSDDDEEAYVMVARDAEDEEGRGAEDEEDERVTRGEEGR